MHTLKNCNASIAWVDLIEPTKEEKRAVEQCLNIEIPTRDEVQEIEQSSRLYQEEQTLYMTAAIPVDQKISQVINYPVTFVLSKSAVVTVRYGDIPLLDSLMVKPNRLRLDFHDEPSPKDELSLLNPILDAIVDYVADLLEKSMNEVELLSRELFHRHDLVATPSNNGRRDFSKILYRIGLQGDSVSSLRESLSSLSRLIGFLSKKTGKKSLGISEPLLSTLEKDVISLSDHALFVSNKIGFLLEATLGLINIEQNMIIKTFSIAAVIFLPPTLLASIWGMNYEYMPELSLRLGYPFALFCIAISSFIPYYYFKMKRWL